MRTHKYPHSQQIIRLDNSSLHHSPTNNLTFKCTTHTPRNPRFSIEFEAIILFRWWLTGAACLLACSLAHLHSHSSALTPPSLFPITHCSTVLLLSALHFIFQRGYIANAHHFSSYSVNTNTRCRVEHRSTPFPCYGTEHDAYPLYY